MTEMNEMEYDFSKKDIEDIGVFISYAHKDKECFKGLITELQDDGINILSDEQISAGVSDFHKAIKNMLVRSTCAIVLYNDSLTPWMLFEIGILKGLNKKIFIYSQKNNVIPNYLSDCEVVSSKGELKEKCKNVFLFSDLLNNDSCTFTKKEYYDYVKDKIKYVSLKIKIPGIEKIEQNAYQFRYIIPGMFKSEKITKRQVSLCYKVGDKLEECECKCYEKYKECPYNKFEIPSNKKEIVILNKVYDSVKVDGNEIEYLIPINEQYGVTFKCFVDIKDFTLKNQIIKLLINANVIDAKESGSAIPDRIYFTLPKKPYSGLFESESEEKFCNNYFCPGVLN